MSFGEMFFLVFLALIVFGPKRLPEMARKLGKIMGELRRASNEFKSQIEEEVRKLEMDEATKAIGVNLNQTSNSVSRVPLDQQILPPSNTQQEVTEHSFEPTVESTHEASAGSPVADEVSGQHA